MNSVEIHSRPLPVATPLVPIRATVRGVLGEYDHVVSFPEGDQYAILYGPNGIGKTKLLEIIHALTRLDARSLKRLPFDSAQIEYSDGTVLSVAAVRESSEGKRARQDPSVLAFLLRDLYNVEEWAYSGEDLENWLLENSTWRRIDEHYWEDRTDGEIVPFSELERRYPDRAARDSALPTMFRKFKNRVSSYLIETQRLRIAPVEPLRGRLSLYRQGVPEGKESSKISEHASRMRDLIMTAQTEHSRKTQQLDRDFPNRVLSAPQVTPGAETVRRRHEEQNDLRSRLARVASIELQDALALPDRPLADWELLLLNLYLDDAAEKLSPFEDLLSKIEMFESVVNSRLLNKKIRVTAKDGLSVVHTRDKQQISLESLSSGEQHEIILMFDLLFRVKPGSLVLIDEPEISLHVAWQLAFIPDVERISRIANFRFLVATHSPQIINGMWEQTQRLGPTDAAFS